MIVAKPQPAKTQKDLYVMLLFGGHVRPGTAGEKVGALSWNGVCNFPDGYPAPLPTSR